jgi:hypothetical protein
MMQITEVRKSSGYWGDSYATEMSDLIGRTFTKVVSDSEQLVLSNDKEYFKFYHQQDIQIYQY